MDEKGVPMNATQADVVIVGSGIVGLGAAYAAVRRGHRVIVIDRTEGPVGATVRNFGHICIGAQIGQARQYGDVSATSGCVSGTTQGSECVSRAPSSPPDTTTSRRCWQRRHVRAACAC